MTGDDESKLEVYEDTLHIFAPRLLWFKTLIGKEGLKDGETHDPSGKCEICNMVFSNVSGSFVEALIRQQGGKGGKMGFVYQLKGEALLTDPNPVLSVSLEVGEKLIPMIKLKISAGDCKCSSRFHHAGAHLLKLDQVQRAFQACFPHG